MADNPIKALDTVEGGEKGASKASTSPSRDVEALVVMDLKATVPEVKACIDPPLSRRKVLAKKKGVAGRSQLHSQISARMEVITLSNG